METVELNITDVVYRGKGLARAEGCVIFVPDTLPGETVRARITKQKKNYAEAELVKVLNPSEHRREPECPLAGICPGCCYQHVEYDAEVMLKQAQLENLIERATNLDDIHFLPPVKSPTSLGYRNKIMLHSAVQEEKKVLGYYGRDNKTLIDIENCPLAMEGMNKLLKELRSKEKFMNSLRNRTTVTIRHTQTNGTLFWKGPGTEERLMETTRLGLIRVPRNSFFQINPQVSDMLLDIFEGLIVKIQPKNLIDLYCGVGTFAICAAQNSVPHVLGVDSNDPAIRSAHRNAVKLGLEEMTFICGPAESTYSQAIKPVNARETTLVLDPPRKGLPPSLVQQISDSKPADIIYVSCAADTLARDLQIFITNGYSVSSSQLVDMFPRTPYFESITHLTRG